MFNLLQVLESLVKQCLQEADKCQATSIAFPSLGAGNLEYPPKVVARVMVKTIATYLKSHRETTSLETVKLVIFLTVVFKEFNDIFKNRTNISVHNSHSTITQQSVSLLTSNRTTTTTTITKVIIAGDDSDAVVTDAPAVLHINVFARNSQQVQSTLTVVQKVLLYRFKIHVIENDNRVIKLTKEQVRDLEEKAKVQQVK